jgi:DNA replication factor GINS
MNLDELQSVQARERQSSDLQHLRSSFYREVGEFIGELNDERARVVEAADDPFSEPEVRRLTDDIETAEGTVEAIYERRVGKVVKKASIAAAGMPVEEDGLTREEEALFTDLVARIEENREQVLSVLDGETTTVSCTIDDGTADTTENSAADDPATSDRAPADRSPAADPDSPSNVEPGVSADGDGINAADLMGGAAGDDTSDSAANPSRETPSDSPAAQSTSSGDPTPGRDVPSVEAVAPDSSPVDIEPSSPSTAGDDGESNAIPGLPRTTVRITADVGEIVGADDRDYDLGPEDVVTLPEPNADVLVEKNAAERL